MTNKEIVDALLKLLQILISWPGILLVFLFALRREIPQLISNLSDRITKAPGGFEFAVLEKKVDQIASTVEKIGEQLYFQPTASLTPKLQQKLDTAFVSYRNYLNSLGYSSGESRVEVEIRPNYPNAHYEEQANKMVLGETFAHDLDVLFREYTHHVLMSYTDEYNTWSNLYMAIESGLADYFPCSFNNDERLGKQMARAAYDQPFIRNLNNDKKFTLNSYAKPHFISQAIGEIWGGAFWEMRATLGQVTTDKLLFTTWSKLGPTETASQNPLDFIKKLWQHPELINNEQVNIIKEIFKRRGVKIK